MFRFFRWLFNCPRITLIAYGKYHERAIAGGPIIKVFVWKLYRDESGKEFGERSDGYSSWALDPIFIREYLMQQGDSDDDKNSDDPVKQPGTAAGDSGEETVSDP